MNRTSQALIAVWVVIAAGVAFLIADLMSTRRQAEARVRDQAVSYVRLIEQHASAAFDRSNMALRGVIDHLRPGDMIAGDRLPEKRRKEIDALLLSHQQRTAGVGTTYVADADGNIIAHSLGAIAPVDVSDRTHFQTLKRQPRTAVAVSEAVLGRVTNTWGVNIGRRVDLPDGRFGGMVNATLGLDENFTNFYSSLPLGKDSAITLRDPENRLLVRHPVVEEKLGLPVATSGWVRERLLAGDMEGVVTIASNIDGIERVFAFRRLSNYPIYAAIGLSLDEALAGWRDERNTMMAGGLLLLVAGLFITAVLRRNQRAEQGLAESEARFRGLAEQSLVGIVLYGEEGFQYVNPGFARIFGYGQNEFIQLSLLDIVAEKDKARVVEAMRDRVSGAVAQGHYAFQGLRKDRSTVEIETYSSRMQIAGKPVAVGVMVDITERKRVQEQIQYQAHYDALTGIPNRSLFYDRLTQGMVLAKRDRCELALLYLDLDRFKAVNDKLGHEAGDEVLKITAARIRHLLRESDTVSRIGGDEFTVILPRIASREDAAEVASKIVDALAVSFQLSGSNGNAHVVSVGCSVGISIFPTDAESADGLVVAADVAMYEAKHSGLGVRFSGTGTPYKAS